LWLPLTWTNSKRIGSRSPPVINAASQVSFLVSGASKSAIVKQILGATPARPDYPAARVNPANGSLTWFIDAAAATGLR